MAEPLQFKYRAFLSYSHRDKAWGKWLHHALEGYRIDRDLVGRETPAGPVPKSLRPIFRDREDFSAGHSLTEQTIAALEGSQFLIVLCSPNAVDSTYVNEEVRRFKAMGRADRVIPVIVAGELADGSAHCFPPALRFKVGTNGALTDEREEPIAADARPEGDGKDIARQKAVAGLLGLGLDEIARRAERARKRRNRVWAALAGLFLLLTVAAAGSAVYAWQQLKTNEAFLDATLSTATGIVDTAVAQAEKYNVPRTATLELLAKAERLFDDMARLGRPTPQLAYRKAAMLLVFASNYTVLGQTDKRRERAMEAYRLMQTLSAENPSDLAWQNDLSVSNEAIGDVLLAEGKLDVALASYRAGLAIRENLVAADPTNVLWQRNLSALQALVGDIFVRQGKPDEALASYLEAVTPLTIALGADTSVATKTVLLRDTSVLEQRLGDMYKAQGRLDEGLAIYSTSLATFQLLADTYPDNAVWSRYLSSAHVSIGDVLLAQGKLEEALASYRTGLTISQRLADADRTNAVSQRDLSVLRSRLGDALKAQGKLDEALATYRASHATAEHLVAADRTDTNLQRDLSLSHQKIGDVLLAQGKVDEAVVSYRGSLSIAEILAALDPTNAAWLSDLSVAYNRIGVALEGQGTLADALESYRASHAIAERLAAAEPDNVELQLNAVSSNINLAHHGDDPVRRIAFTVATLRKLKDQNKLPAEKARWLPLAEHLWAHLQAQ